MHLEFIYTVKPICIFWSAIWWYFELWKIGFIFMPMFNHWHKYKWDRIYYFFCPCLMAVASCSLIRDRTQALGSEKCRGLTTELPGNSPSLFLTYQHMIICICQWCTVTWPVYDQLRDQCMISHVISAWSGMWWVHVQSRDKCMISSWLGHDHHHWDTRSLHDKSRDQFMISHVISAWSASW